jgi:hypothetical protein
VRPAVTKAGPEERPAAAAVDEVGRALLQVGEEGVLLRLRDPAGGDGRVELLLRGWPWSQPFFAPVNPSRSRRTSSSDVRVSRISDRSSPFTRSEISTSTAASLTATPFPFYSC